MLRGLPYTRARFMLLVLFYLLPAAVARGGRKGGKGEVSDDVDVAFQFADAIDISTFSLDVLFAIITFFQAYYFLGQLLHRPKPVAVERAQDTPPTAPATQSPREGQKPGTVINGLLALTSFSLLAWWILSAVSVGLETSSFVFQNFGFPRAFYASKQWIYRFADTCLFAAVLLLVRRRAGAYPTLSPISGGFPKLMFDGSMIVFALVTQIVGAVFNSSWQFVTSEVEIWRRIKIWENTNYAYSASELLLALDVAVTSLIVWNVLAREHTSDFVGFFLAPATTEGLINTMQTIRIVTTRVTPLLAGIALLNLAIAIIDGLLDTADIDIQALSLSQTLIYGIGMMMMLSYCSSIGGVPKKKGTDEESDKESNSGN